MLSLCLVWRDTNSFQSLTFKKVIGKFHCQNIQRNTLLLGLFQFTVLPFGLVTAQASCSRLMRKLLQSLQNVDNFVDDMGRAKRIRYLSPMRTAKVQASLRIRAVSPEPSLLAHTSSESRGTFRQKARSLAPLNGWACAVKICHVGMLEDTNSLDAAHIIIFHSHLFGIFSN